MRTELLAASIALIMCACGPKDVKPLDMKGMTFGWDTNYDKETHHVDFNGAWSGRGWLFGEEGTEDAYEDASEYDRVVISISGIKGPMTKLNLCVGYATTETESRDLSTIVNGNTTLRVDLDKAHKDKVKKIYLLCDTVCEMKIEEAYLEKSYEYGEPKELTMSNIGIISSDQFEGYSDHAKVDFSFETKGDIMGVNKYGEKVDMKGWGVGIICSAADILGADLPSRDIVFTNLGKHTYSCELGDLKYLLSLKDDDGECGIYWTVMKIGGLTEANIISTTISEAVGRRK